MPDVIATEPRDDFSIPGRDREAAGGVELQRKAIIPLFVREREHVGLGDGAGNAGDGVDPAKGFARRSDDGSGSFLLAQISGEDERFCSRRPNRINCLDQGFLCPRHQRHGTEVAGQADGGRTSHAAARASDDGQTVHQTRAWAMASVSIYWRKVVILPPLTVQTWA